MLIGGRSVVDQESVGGRRTNTSLGRCELIYKSDKRSLIISHA